MMVSPSLWSSAFFGGLQSRGLALQLAEVEEAGALHLALLHQLDRLRTHLRTLSDYRSPKNNLPSSLLPCEQIGAALACARHRLLAPPLCDLAMIAGQQHIGHPEPAELRRARVLRPLEQAFAGKTLRLCGKLVSQHTRNEPRDRLDHCQRRHLAAVENEISQRNLLVHPAQDALVDAFVAPADEDQGTRGGQIARLALIEARP